MTCFLPVMVSAAPPQSLEIHKGDHIAIVGNGLADRQQHHGWFETLLHKAYPDAELTVRNFGFPGDEIDVHPRSKDVPPIEWWLSMKKGDSSPPDRPEVIYKAGTDFGADVILAYWGFNESFHDSAGVADFRTRLDQYLTKLLSSNFNGHGAPRVVLFSPIACEGLDDRHAANLAQYTAVMAEVAASKHVPFVDLLGPSRQLFEAAKSPLTINGIHLTEVGDKLLAPIQFKALFGKDAPAMNDPSLEKIRAAVLDKNTEWHHRYRTVDQFNIYGDRSRIAYAGVTNARILCEELAQRDVKAANRDKVVWAAANGKTIAAVDDNLPPVELTPSNEVGGGGAYVDPEQAMAYLTLAPNCKISLVASELQFPEFVNPVQMSFDTKGRLWVAVWPNYPETSPTTKVFDKILVIDLDPTTGKAAKITTFADGLNCPTGFQFYKDGILLMQSPDLLYLRDTNGDGKADWKERLLHGLDAADSHHETNSICYEPGGAVYLSDGVFHRTNVETPNGVIRNHDGGIYRYEPVTGKFMRHAPYGFANPHGRVFDYWGNDLITDATGNDNYFGPAMSGHLDEGAHSRMETFWDQPSRPCPGTAILSSRHFPDEWQGQFLDANVISFQGIFRAKLSEEGSGIQGETIDPLLSADIAKNPNFRPSGITVAPDGSLYMMDWSQMLIGHLQHHLRDPNRDHQHGRLYRITYEGRPLLVPKKIDGQPIPALLKLLKEPENDVRLRAKIELGKHDAKEVTSAVVAWVKSLDAKDPAYEHHLLEALWVHQWHDVVNFELLDRVLKSPESRARAQGLRVLGYWRDRIPNALALVKEAANDEAPRVRLEAVRVASYFREAAAAEAALTALKKPTDYYIDYCLKETMRQLEPWWKQAIAAGNPFAADNPAGVTYLMKAVPTPDLLKLPESPVTRLALVTREDIPTPQRIEALAKLAALQKESSAASAVRVLKNIDAASKNVIRDLGMLLHELPVADLKAVLPQLEDLAAHSNEGVAANALAAAMRAHGSVEPAWQFALRSPASMVAFIRAVALVPDKTLQATAATRIKNLLDGLPPELSASLQGAGSCKGRFVRISLPGRKGTLSLAEVEVISGGSNVAPSGKASQASVAWDGDPNRAIDGNTDGIYNSGSTTHTKENINNPWWELDLGAEKPIDEITIWNRSDGAFGARLEGFELAVLDSARHEVFKRSALPAPAPSSRVQVKSDAAAAIRRAALAALPEVLGEAAFGLLAETIAKGNEVPTAVAAIAQMKANDPAATARAVAGIASWARSVPAAQRTSEEFRSTMEASKALLKSLPPQQAEAAASDLANLDVKRFTIHTVREQLLYDTARIVVEPGRMIEIVLENPDAMPHNLVVTQPGAAQPLAIAVQIFPPDKLDSKGRAYVPENDPRVLAATKLVQAGKSESLTFTTPSAEGTYPYVCTFPGHWTVMKGELIVTRDVEAYLTAHPGK